MTEKFKILAKFIRDLSSETPDIETYLFVKDVITRYKMDIDINSRALKNNMIEINTSLKFEDKNQAKNKSVFEINYVTVIKIDESVKDKKELEKIILCDVQNKIYPDLEKSFLDLIHNSGYPEMKLEKKVDFNFLYSQRAN